MCDIRCVVCGEPWDAYGVNHGDMCGWEAELFRAGAGCPCCKGEKPSDGAWEPRSIFDLSNGDGDEGERLAAWEASRDGSAPKWQEPAPEVLWACDGCGVQALRSPEDGDVCYRLPPGAKGSKWFSSHNYWSGCPEAEPAHVFKDKRKVCEFCLSNCSECGKALSSVLEFGDVYDDGHSFEDPGYYHRCMCIDCYSEAISEIEEEIEAEALAEAKAEARAREERGEP